MSNVQEYPSAIRGSNRCVASGYRSCERVAGLRTAGRRSEEIGGIRGLSQGSRYCDSPLYAQDRTRRDEPLSVLQRLLREAWLCSWGQRERSVKFAGNRILRLGRSHGATFRSIEGSIANRRYVIPAAVDADPSDGPNSSCRYPGQARAQAPVGIHAFYMRKQRHGWRAFPSLACSVAHHDG